MAAVTPAVNGIAEPSQKKAADKITPPRPTASRTTVKVTDLLKVSAKVEKSEQPTSTNPQSVKPFTREEFEVRWEEFAQQRKKFQAEYQLLGQPYDLDETKVRLHLLSPVQETLLANIKSELVTYLREQLGNDMIVVNGVVIESDDKKIMYTSRDKFEYLQDKIPLLAELKERLGLDTDF